MRILHLIQRFHPARGGAELYLLEFASALVAQGHEVTVVTTDADDFAYFWDSKRARFDETNTTYRGITIQRFKINHLPWAKWTFPLLQRLLWIGSTIPFVPLSWLRHFGRLMPPLPDLWDWLVDAEDEFDLVVGMTLPFDTMLLAGQWAAKKWSVPFVTHPLTHLGAGDAPGADKVSRFYTLRHQIDLVCQSDLVICQTPTERNYYINQHLPIKRLEIVGPGVHPKSVTGGDGTLFRETHNLRFPIVLSVGSLTREKGVFDMIAAIISLWRAGIKVDLVLIGTVSDEFQRYWNQLDEGVQHRICLLPSASDDVKRDAYAAAQIFAMPSKIDSVGMVYFEAWLNRLPVIAAQTWGVMDIVTDGVDGYLVPFGDAEAIAAKVKWLLQAGKLAASLGETGHQRVREVHIWSHKCQMLETIYRDVVANA